MNTNVRISKARTLLDTLDVDALVVRDTANLRWLTGASRVFDFENAHTALITSDGLWLHTDSRYYNAFVDRLGTDGAWCLDMEDINAGEWVAGKASGLGLSSIAFEDTLTVRLWEQIRSSLRQASPRCEAKAVLADQMLHMRAVKDASEIEVMKAAQAITDAAFEHMCGFIEPGLTELQVRAELDNYMLANGADSLSFDSIVASGPNTANPHALPGPRVIAPGEFVLLDYGAGLDDYKSDMTRTVAVGEPTAELRAIYDAVRFAHERCAAAIRPGVTGVEVHELAVRLIEEAGYGGCFRHGLGHGVGIQIHEDPRLGRQGTPSVGLPLQEGMVVTVEPGVYVSGVGGVRLEDYGVVTADGFDPFTRSTHDLVVL